MTQGACDLDPVGTGMSLLKRSLVPFNYIHFYSSLPISFETTQYLSRFAVPPQV